MPRRYNSIDYILIYEMTQDKQFRGSIKFIAEHFNIKPSYVFMIRRIFDNVKKGIPLNEHCKKQVGIVDAARRYFRKVEEMSSNTTVSIEEVYKELLEIKTILNHVLSRLS